MKQQYLMTGAGGFVGTNLADYYLWRIRRVTKVSNGRLLDEQLTKGMP